MQSEQPKEREAKLEHMREQISSGALVIRRTTRAERAKSPSSVRSHCQIHRTGRTGAAGRTPAATGRRHAPRHAGRAPAKRVQTRRVTTVLAWSSGGSLA